MPISAFDYPETIKNFLSSPEFNEVPDEEKPLHVEGFRRSFVEENGISDKIDLDFVNESSANMFGDYRKKLNIPRFTPTPEQALDLYGPININPKDDIEKRIASIEQWRDQAKPKAAEKSPSTAEDFEYHVEDLANNYIKNELAKDSYKPGGAPDWLMDASKRFTENAIRGVGVDLLAEYKDAQRWFAKNLVENPEFDDNYGSQVIGGLGNVLSQLALSAGLTMAGAPELAPVALVTMSVARHMSESYQRELKRTGNELMAQDAAANAIPAGMIDAGPEIFLRGFFNKAKGFKEAFTAAATTEAKRQVIKDAIPGIVSTAGKGFVMEGLVGGVGTDVAQNMGDYLATGDKRYYEAAINIGELANTFAVEGTVGAIAGGMVAGITKSGNQEATAKVMAELSKKQDVEKKVLAALKENNFDSAIRIVTEASAAPAAPSSTPTTTPVKDAAEATLKDRLGEDIVQQNKFKAENSPYVKPIDQTIAKLKKNPEANQSKIAELEKARLVFEDTNGPKQFVPQTEFDLTPESIDLTQNFAKKKSSFDVTLDDDSTISDESTIFVKPEDGKNGFLRDVNLRQVVKGNPGIKISPSKIKFDGSKKEYTTSLSPNPGWTPVQINNGKIKILPPVKSFVKKEAAKPSEKTTDQTTAKKEENKSAEVTPILQTAEEEAAAVETDTVEIGQPEVNKLAEKLGIPAEQVPAVKPKKTRNRNKKKVEEVVPEPIITPEPVQEVQPEPVVEQPTPEQPVNMEVEAINSALKFQTEKLATLEATDPKRQTVEQTILTLNERKTALVPVVETTTETTVATTVEPTVEPAVDERAGYTRLNEIVKEASSTTRSIAARHEVLFSNLLNAGVEVRLSTPGEAAQTKGVFWVSENQDGQLELVLDEANAEKTEAVGLTDQAIFHEAVHAAQALFDRNNEFLSNQADKVFDPKSNEFDQELDIFMGNEVPNWNGIRGTRNAKYEAVRALLEAKHLNKTSRSFRQGMPFVQYLSSFIEWAKANVFSFGTAKNKKFSLYVTKIDRLLSSLLAENSGQMSAPQQEATPQPAPADLAPALEPTVEQTVEPAVEVKPIEKGVLKNLVSLANKDGIKYANLNDLIKRGFISEEQLPVIAEMYGAPAYNGDLDAFAKGLTAAIRKGNAEQNRMLSEIEKFRNETQATLFKQRENNPENKERRAQQTNAIKSLAKDVRLSSITIVNSHEELGRADVDENVQAFVEGGNVTMILDNIIPYQNETTIEATERIFKHEVVGHLKMSKVLSGISKNGYNNLIEFLKGLEFKNGDNVWEKTKAVYTTEQNGETVTPDDSEIVDEIFAKLTENKNKETQSIVSKIVKWIRTKFLKAGIKNWTVNDLYMIIQVAFNTEIAEGDQLSTIRFAKTVDAVYLDSVIVGYGAWVSPGGKIINVSQQDHFGKAIEIIGEENTENMTVDGVYDEMRSRGYLRVVNTNGSILVEESRKPSPQQRAVLEFAGINGEKDVYLDGKQIYKTPVAETRFSKIDSDYFAAVEAGDMESAQRMVDAAAKAAGKRKLYHVGQMERPALRQESVTGGVGEVYLTEQPTAWAAALEREGDPVSQWYLPDSTIAKTQPSRRELVDWAISRGFMEMKSVTKPDGTTVFELDDKTPLIRPEETLKGKSLPFYNTQDPMRGGNQQKHLIYAYLKERGFAAYEAEYSRDGHEIIVFAPSQIKSADPVTRDDQGNVIPLSQRFNSESNDIRFSKAQPQVEEVMDDDFLMTDNNLISNAKSTASREYGQLLKRKLGQRLIIKEVNIYNAFEDIQYAYLPEDRLTALLNDFRDFVNTRTSQENPATTRIDVDALESRLIQYKKDANQAEYNYWKEKIEKLPDFVDTFKEDIGAVRAMVYEIINENKREELADISINDSDVATIEAIHELQFMVIDRVDIVDDIINRGTQEFAQGIKELGHPILDKGVTLMRDHLAAMKKLFNEYTLNLVTIDPTELSKADMRRVYYALLSLSTDGYPNRLNGFISSEIQNLLKIADAKFTNPYGDVERTKTSRFESTTSMIERMATDDYSYDLLIKLQAPLRDGLALAKRYHEEIITPYVEELNSKYGVMDADTLNKIGIFGVLRQRFMTETPEAALKDSFQWLIDSNKNITGFFDGSYRAQGNRHNEYVFKLFDGINYKIENGRVVADFTKEDVDQFYENANIFLGQKGIGYADDVVRLFESFKPLARFTTEFIYGRTFEEVDNYIPTMSVIIKGEGNELDMSKAQMLTDAKSFSSGQIFYGTNTTGLGSTKQRTRTIGTNRTLVLNINYMAESLGRVAVYDYFTANARQEMAQLLNHDNKNGKMLAKFLGDPEQNLYRMAAFRDAMNGMWQNVMSQASYLHPYHVMTNWLGRKWAQDVLSGVHQLPAQAVSNLTPYFVQHINEPRKIANFVRAIGYITKYKSGMLDQSQTALMDRVLFEVMNRQQFQEIDKSVNLNISPNSFIEGIKKNLPLLYKSIKTVDSGIEKFLFMPFKASDILSGAPMMLAEYLNNEQDSKGTHVRFEDLTYNPASYHKSVDAVERYIGIGDASRRGEFLTNKNAGISIARNLSIAFRSFAINNAVNFGKEWHRIHDSEVSSAQKVKSIKYMLGIVGQSVVYTKIATAISGMVATQIINAIRHPEEEEELKDLYRKSQNRMSQAERKNLELEISMRKQLRKITTSMENRVNDNRIINIRTAKDAISNMSIVSNIDLIPNLFIHLVLDGPAEENFREWKSGEIERIEKALKRHKNLGNYKTVTKLTEELSAVNMQEFLPAVFEKRSIAGLGGSFGGTAEGIVDAAESSVKAWQNAKAMTPVEWLQMSAMLGVSQPDLKKLMNAYSKKLEVEAKYEEARAQ